MIRILLFIVALGSHSHQFLLDRPTPPVILWEGWFSFTGLHDEARKIVIRDCVPVRSNIDTSESRARFCETAGQVTGRPDFCFTTGKQTRERCENIIEQNANWYLHHAEIIYMYPEDYKKVEKHEHGSTRGL